MLLTDKYADKIYGTITCYDRLIIQGYPGWSYAEGMTSYLKANSSVFLIFQVFLSLLQKRFGRIHSALTVLHGSKLPSLCPGVGGASFGEHIADGIIGHGCAVPVQQLIFPDSVIRSGLCHGSGSRKGSRGISIFFLAYQVASKIIAVGHRLVQNLVVLTGQTVQLIILPISLHPVFCICF